MSIVTTLINLCVNVSPRVLVEDPNDGILFVLTLYKLT
jgi:hypothetical protein